MSFLVSISAAMTDAALSPARAEGPPRARLWLEFAALFVAVPVAMWVWFGAYSLFGVLWLLTLVALGLLAMTPGFSWRALLRVGSRRDWLIALGFAVITALVCLVAVLALRPWALLSMPMDRTGLWLMILALYPPLSALPQEIIYRTLFFERYGRLFPDARLAVLANGAAFGLGHLFFMHPLTIAMTACGGAAIGWAYLRSGSTLLATAMHAAAGLIVFTMGLGVYFYSGAVGRGF